jgi:hypothetical protein
MSMKRKSRGQAGTAFSTAKTTISPRDPVRAKMSSIAIFGMENLKSLNGIANAYKTLAENIYHAAKNMPQNTVPQHILLYHTIELALKGYLLQNAAGLNEKKLKDRFSHNLEKLYAAAKANGLNVQANNDAELIKWANEHHNFGLLRYNIENFKELPYCTDIYPIIDAILAAIVPETIKIA